jgi:predicted PurR-regulated permease PerM
MGSPTSRDRLSLGVLITLTAIGFVLLALVIMPFTSGLVWAFAFAVIADPWYCRLRARIHRPQIAAGLGVIAVTLILVVPTSLVIWRVGKEVQQGLTWVQQQIESGRLREMVQGDPRLARVAGVFGNVDIAQEVRSYTESVPKQAGQWLRRVVSATVQLLIALFTLFFFFRDRDAMIKYARSLMPLSAAETTYFFERIRTMTHATIYGTVVVALIQGALGTVMLLLLGIPGAVLWGAVMAVASIVPNLGAFVVWLPIAVALGLQGSWGKALILGGWGLFVVSTIDNVLYPMLVNKEIRLHTLPVFLAIIGGLFLFGAPGLVLGPVILAATIALLDILKRRTANARPAAERA